MGSSPVYIIIKGITEDGGRFRPSDWAERLATAVGEFGPDRRVHFHPQVRPATVDDTKCVLVDEDLQHSDSMLFDFLIHFAKDNHLQMESDVSFDEKGKHKAHAG
ncbi:MAG TPA: DUF3579 domain-containing protein [Gammaproteobacteria bacterium]|nr:DUF3579 domain-containing protein [Gammaproteobacteria bacterium]